MDRRDFIKLTLVSGSGATLAACGNPEHQLIRFIPDDDIAPGVATWKPSICPMCPAGCGLTVRVMDADVETTRGGQTGVVKMNVAKKLEGDPAHPISRGGLCARGQAAIQVTYHPDRLQGPRLRTGARGANEWKDLSWDDATAELVRRLDDLAATHDQKSLAYLTPPRRGRRLALATAFLSQFGAPAPLTFEAFGDDVLRRANGISFGHAQLPTIDLARSALVLAFGADFLGPWNSPVAQTRAYSRMRQGHPGMRGKLVQVESRMSLTGANADEWLPIRPGTEGFLALGLAHVIVADEPRRAQTAGAAGAAIEGWLSGLAEYAPDRVESITGVTASRIERLARELVDRSPAVAVIGGAPLAHTNGLFHALAVNALNGLLGAIGQPGGLFFTPHSPDEAPPSRFTAGAIAPTKLLLLDDVNPVFGSPQSMKIREAIQAVPFIVSFGSFIDDTSVFADLLLPDHSFLESWVDSSPESGSIDRVTSVAGPVMKPLHQTRATVDLLLQVAGAMKAPIALPWKTTEEVARSTPVSLAVVGPPPVPAIASAAPQFDGDPAEYPFYFLPYLSQQFGDGSAAHLPWLQEMPDPLTSAMWSSWVEINPRTAERLGIGQGDLVDIASSHGVLRAPAMIFPGIAPDMVAMPVGQGHETFTRYASGRGANPIAILAPIVEADTGALAWAATRVKVQRAGDDDGRLTMFAGGMREHPHEHEER